MKPLTIVDGGLQALHSWLELIWPYLLLLPLLNWALIAGPDRLRSLWCQTLEHPLGDLWPVPAAILPALIPFARDWDKSAPTGTKRFSVAGLLLAIAVIQIYGQLRSQRYRKAADDAIDRIGAGVEEQGAQLGRIGAGVNSIGAEVNSIGAGVDRIGSGVEEQGAQLGRLASYLAAEEEEESRS